jgi:hypothetical protein
MQSNPREDAELNTKNPCKNERAPFARGYPFMTTIKTDFAYRIDRWDPSGNVVQRVADVDDLAVAVETYEAACKRWPGNCFTLRQGSRVIADSRQTQPAKK